VRRLDVIESDSAAKTALDEGEGEREGGILARRECNEEADVGDYPPPRG